ncbi:MAG: Lipoprotein signal peptidase [Anaerolineales bacterium]|nr:Lipoprotein signal peptidase [Anaerolineales bacterium]
MKHKLPSYLFLFSISGAIIALDQWTKWLVRQHIPYTGQWLPQSLDWLMPYARIVHWQNSGAAFGLFQSGSWIFGSLAVVVIGAIVYFYGQVDQREWGMRVAMAMQLAGAAGNLIDRLLFDGKVTDFISVGNFPVFNVADASITLGVAVLVLDVWIKERKEKKNREQMAGNSEQSSVGSDSVPDAVSKPEQGANAS